MQILLVNSNHIISKLFSLSSNSLSNIDLHELKIEESIPNQHYDILFIDIGSSSTRTIEEYIYRVDAKKKILFATDRELEINGIDKIITKPFLPSTVMDILRSYPEDIKSGDRESRDSNTEDKSLDSIILDSGEIETIKRLLLDEELDVSRHEEEGSRDNYIDKSTNIDHQDDILDRLLKEKPKKIKKILAGAEVTITIKFPKEV
jgi:hypothetical protein